MIKGFNGTMVETIDDISNELALEPMNKLYACRFFSKFLLHFIYAIERLQIAQIKIPLLSP